MGQISHEPVGGVPDEGRFPLDPHAPDPGVLVAGAPGPTSEQAATEVVYDWSLESDEITWGPSYRSIPGLPAMAAVSTGLGYAEHLAAESPSSRYEAVMAPGGCDTGGGVPFKTVYGLVGAKRSQAGRGRAAPVWVEDSGRWFADRYDRPARVHGVIRIITERYEAECRRTAAAQRDPVTGAYNRAYFIEHVARHLSLTARKSSTFAVLLIAVEREGSSVAVDDAGIADAGARLRHTMRSHEILARHAGAKFAALLDGCDEGQAMAAVARLTAAVRGAEPGENGDAVAATGLLAKVGAVIAPFHGRTPQALLQFAEQALEAAHQPAASGFALYRPELTRARPPGGSETADEIRTALADNRLALALQPIVAAGTRQVAFFEGLVRVKRADAPPILPDALVPRAEKTGLVPLIDRRVVELAFALLTADRKLRLSINAAVPSLSDPQWLGELRAACRLRPDAARRLTVEVTETCAIADIEATRVTLAAIKPLGVKIAIDDFGSGHSSFRSLRQLPIDYLKIDGAFSQNLASSSDDRFFIRALIDLARNLNIPTVAEWVEDEETAGILTDWGVNYLQGHLFGRAELAVTPVAASRPPR